MSDLNDAIDKLAFDFENIRWKYLQNDEDIKTQLWPGDNNEDIIICVYKGKRYLETFHKQEFFFFNFAYVGDYNAKSFNSNNQIVVKENECYVGQPKAGYSIFDESTQEKIIIRVLIQNKAFFKTFFNVLATDHTLFNFFLKTGNKTSLQDFIHIKFEDKVTIRKLLELMIIEYANKKDDTQEILKPLTLALLMNLARAYKKQYANVKEMKLSEKILAYVGQNLNRCSLKLISNHFNYHPNYLSNLLSKEFGQSFSQILLKQRMQRAQSLINETSLPISEIAQMVGYTNTSNFHKAFKKFFNSTPRNLK